MRITNRKILLFFIICILPFLVYLIVYDNGLSTYSWYPEDGTSFDFYVYYKSRFFIFIAMIAFVWLVIDWIRHKIEKQKIWILLILYAVLVIASTVYSINQDISIVGFTNHFENCFVILGYLVIAFFSYQAIKTKKDADSLIKYVFITTCLFTIIALLQVLKIGVVHNLFIQRLVMSKSDYQNYAGKFSKQILNGALPLTLDNPNYAGVFLSMIFCFTSTLFFLRKKQEKNKKVNWYLLASCILLVCIVLTKSRNAILVSICSLCFFLIIQKNIIKIRKKQIILFCICSVFIILGTDAVNDFSLIKRWKATIQTIITPSVPHKLEKIEVKKDRVSVFYNGEKTEFSMIDGKVSISGKANGLTARVEYFNQDPILYINIEDKDWRWLYTKEGYIYVNEFGKSEKWNLVQCSLPESFDKIASNRGYIWSRTLPFVLNYFVIGSGPDTFAFVFPQEDRIGKYYNCKEIYSIIEKPHNMYLQTAIQTGFLSLCLLLGFFGYYVYNSFNLYRKISQNSIRANVGMACFISCISFLISGMFNDSMVQTSSLFWCFLGVGMRINRELGKEMYEKYN